ncbi:serine/threonine-protein kinase [Pseudomarimonas arenosa]|uniref:Serine/threonine protein kinase n=1 Tax=Pseudomarimonas arenosa TaxID=2774145 RepID=A0AAW3ZQW4_9GAMM|nr:serine/threonine-protein kinase [Pseudomarimonas arenosa]MBD8528113.1 serine/threonine protein kinase [Pseudomarimonas arenosa]
MNLSELSADDTQLWREADSVFAELLELPVQERQASLSARSLDTAVRQRVQALLRADACTPEAWAAPQRLGDWLIGEVLGRGGMAVVYRARHASMPEREAALKLVVSARGSETDGPRQEQAILARLQHPHIAPLYDAGLAGDGTPWFAMALIDGQRIDQWCERAGLSPAARVRLLLPVLAAVAYAHRNLVVHRDIKPSNVMVNAEGHPYLLDFGIARLLDAAEQTRTANMAFSPAYAAPEQFRQAPPSTAMDVYGLGALLYRLLAGQPPQRDPQSLLPAPLAIDADVGAGALGAVQELNAIVMQALADAATERYASADALADDLNRWLLGHPVQALRRQGGGYRLAKWIRRHRLVAASLTSAVFSVMLAAVLSLWFGLEADQQRRNALAEQARAEQALAQASVVHRFLLDLFAASFPDRPRGELPTTEELLAKGGELAAARASTEPALSAELLATIAHLYFVRGLHADSQRLLQRAQPLLPALSDRPEVAASIERTLGEIAEARGEIDLAIGHFDAAMRLLDHQPALRSTYFTVAGKRGFLEILRNDPAAAVAHLQPLYAQLLAVDDQSAVRSKVLGALIVAHTRLRDFDRAAALQQSLEQRIAASEGASGRAMAIARINAVGLHVMRAEFALLEQKLSAAIEHFDQVSSGPNQMRAGARIAWAEALRYQGHIERALQLAEQGFAEQIAVLGLPSLQHSLPYQLAALRLNADLDRWIVAEQHLLQAEQLQQQGSAATPNMLAQIRLFRVALNCRQGRWQDDALSALASITDPELQRQAGLTEARCAWQRGDRAAALKRLQALQISTVGAAPGEGLEVALLQAQAADWWQAEGDELRAEQARQIARAALTRAGLKLSALPLPALDRLR